MIICLSVYLSIYREVVLFQSFLQIEKLVRSIADSQGRYLLKVASLGKQRGGVLKHG